MSVFKPKPDKSSNLKKRQNEKNKFIYCIANFLFL